MRRHKYEDFLMRYATFLILTLVPLLAEAGEIKRIWLTHKTTDPSKTVELMTDEPGDSIVRYGLFEGSHEMVRIDERYQTLHHVEIPLKQKDSVYHYSVSSGNQRSANATFKAYPTDVPESGRGRCRLAGQARPISYRERRRASAQPLATTSPAYGIAAATETRTASNRMSS